jgi:hypothetical protein
LETRHFEARIFQLFAEYAHFRTVSRIFQQFKCRLCVLEIYQRHLNSEMQKADEVVPASATNQKPKAARDESGVAGRRDRQGRRGERLRCFGRANIGLAQSLL